MVEVAAFLALLPNHNSSRKGNNQGSSVLHRHPVACLGELELEHLKAAASLVAWVAQVRHLPRAAAFLVRLSLWDLLQVLSLPVRASVALDSNPDSLLEVAYSEIRSRAPLNHLVKGYKVWASLQACSRSSRLACSHSRWASRLACSHSRWASSRSHKAVCLVRPVELVPSAPSLRANLAEALVLLPKAPSQHSRLSNPQMVLALVHRPRVQHLERVEVAQQVAFSRVHPSSSQSDSEVLLARLAQQHLPLLLARQNRHSLVVLPLKEPSVSQVNSQELACLAILLSSQAFSPKWAATLVAGDSHSRTRLLHQAWVNNHSS